MAYTLAPKRRLLSAELNSFIWLYLSVLHAHCGSGFGLALALLLSGQ
jgi:hypothetical protein